jgi:ketopantoate reductase
MMRIAIAGGTGLGYLLASQLSQAAYAYQVVVLSRSVSIDLRDLNFLTE